MTNTIYQIKHIDLEINSSVLAVTQTPNLNLSLDDIATATTNDPFLVEIGNYLLNFGNISKNNPYKSIINEIGFHESGVLVRNQRILLPDSLTDLVLQNLHAGHPGEKRCLALLKQRFYFPLMHSRLLKLIKSCPGCQANTGNCHPPPQQPNDLPKNNNDLWSIDFSSLLPNNNYAIVLCKERSRYPIIKLTKNMTAKTLIGILEKIFVEFGVPKIIKSDNGGTFRSKELAIFFKLHSIFHMKITPYWPNASGLCEGMMRISTNPFATPRPITKTGLKF